MSPPKNAYLFLLIAFFFITASYSNTFKNQFVFDDYPNIVLNEKIRLSLKNISADSVEKASFGSILSKRPVSNLSFALNHLFHGYRVFGYHIVNLFIHIANSLLLFIIFRQVLLDINNRNSQIHEEKNGAFHSFFWIPGIAALLWSIHPVQAQSVTYIVQRMNLLSAMFSLMSFITYQKFTKARMNSSVQALPFVFAGLLFWILGVFSKENAVMLPFAIILYEVIILRGSRKTPILRSESLPYIFFGILLFLGVVYSFSGLDLVNYILKSYSGREFNLIQRLMTQPRVLWNYFLLLLYPDPDLLNLDHHVAKSVSMLNPATTLLSMTGILVLIGWSIKFSRKYALISFSILWFLVTISLESSVIGLEQMFEHRVYFPSIFLFLSFVYYANFFFKNKKKMNMCFVLLIIVFSFCTYERNAVWENSYTIWKDCVRKSPLKPRPNNNYANAIADRGLFKESYLYFQRATELDPNYYEAYYNWGSTLLENGDPSAAIIKFEKTIAIKPDYAYAYNNLGNAMKETGKELSALLMYNKSLEIKPTLIEAYINIANYYLANNDFDKAIKSLEKGIMVNPKNAELYFVSGNIFLQKNDLRKAAEFYQSALNIRPDYKEVYNSLGVLLLKIGKIHEAKLMIDEALNIDPAYTDAKENLKLLGGRIDVAE